MAVSTLLMRRAINDRIRTNMIFDETIWGPFVGYIVFLIVFAFFSAAAFYHCWEFGYAGDRTRIMMTIYSVLGLAIVVGTFVVFFSI